MNLSSESSATCPFSDEGVAGLHGPDWRSHGVIVGREPANSVLFYQQLDSVLQDRCSGTHPSAKVPRDRPAGALYQQVGCPPVYVRTCLYPVVHVAAQAGL